MHPSSSYYDIIAQYYDEATKSDQAWLPPAFLFEQVRHRKLEKDNILDIGIGTGRSIERIVLRGARSITGIDSSSLMLDTCRKKYPFLKTYETHWPHIEMLKDESFSLILASGILEFVSDFEESTRSVAALLRPGGAFVCTYEPIIAGHSCQAHAQSLVVEDTSSKLYVKDFYTYRRYPHEVRESLVNNGLSVEKELPFIAYEKGGSQIVYVCIVCTKHEMCIDAENHVTR